jgi:hypothetical protein
MPCKSSVSWNVIESSIQKQPVWTDISLRSGTLRRSWYETMETWPFMRHFDVPLNLPLTKSNLLFVILSIRNVTCVRFPWL